MLLLCCMYILEEIFYLNLFSGFFQTITFFVKLFSKFLFFFTVRFTLIAFVCLLPHTLVSRLASHNTHRKICRRTRPLQAKVVNRINLWCYAAFLVMWSLLRCSVPAVSSVDDNDDAARRDAAVFRSIEGGALKAHAGWMERVELSTGSGCVSTKLLNAQCWKVAAWTWLRLLRAHGRRRVKAGEGRSAMCT